ncbi:MAG: PQ-loop repeat-containing protein [Alphaproteobacteria bacterium]|nr:PQ-loop repeat-containing protein [Alphaproteobacteria bacterium]
MEIMEHGILQIFGWIGSFAYAISCIPQAYTSVRQGHSHGVNRWFMILWIIGAVCSLIYISPTMLEQLPLVFNFGVGGISASVVLFYCFHERKK